MNKNIDDSLPVETKVVPFVKATQIQGLRKCAEDYPEKVRVVSVGTNADSILKDPSNSKWSDYSVELCGGTHITNSSRARNSRFWRKVVFKLVFVVSWL